MPWKDEFDRAVKEYFGIPLDAEIYIEDECMYYTGCPTCGGDYEFTVEVWYYRSPKARDRMKRGYTRHVYKGKMTEFIKSLGE